MTKSKSSDLHPQAVLTNANFEAVDSGLLRLDSEINPTNRRATAEIDTDHTLGFTNNRTDDSLREAASVHAVNVTRLARPNSEADDHAGGIATADLPQVSTGSSAHQNARTFLQDALTGIHNGSHSFVQQERGIFRLTSRSNPNLPEELFSAAPSRSVDRRPMPADAPMFTQDQIAKLKAGFDQVFGQLDAALGTQVFAENLPLLGTVLQSEFAQNVPGLHEVKLLRDTVYNVLDSLNGYTQSQAETALNSALASNGFSNSSVQVLFSGSDVRLNFVTDHPFAALGTSLDAHLGVPGLGLTTSGTAQTTLDYQFNFGVGVDGAGFYLDTTNPNFQIGFDTKLPGFNASTTLGPLRFMASDLAGNPTDFNAAFTIQLKDGSNNDGKLRLDENWSDPLDATLFGNAAVNLRLKSDLGTAVLPDIASDFNFYWHFDHSLVNPGAPQTGFGVAPTLAFKNVSIGLGSFFSDFINPIFSELQTITGPLKTIVDVLTKPIGFLHNLAGVDISLLNLAEQTGEIDQATYDRIALGAKLVNFIESTRNSGSEARIDLGDFSIGAADPRTAGFGLANVVPQSTRNAIAAGLQDPDAQAFLMGRDSLGGGLSFPILEDPLTAINLLFGRPVDFFTYHVPGLDIGPVGYNEFYPIFGPFGVRLVATVEAHAYLDIGYDSSGITQFATSGDPEDIFNGFFVMDHPGPEAEVIATLSASAAGNIGIAEVGVGGGIVGNISAFFNDNDNVPGDGKIHLAELTNGCDLFTLSGEVTAGLTAYITVDFGLFEETYEKDLGHAVLLSFNSQGCNAQGMPGVPVLAHVLGADVALHVGADTSLRQIGSPDDSVDDFLVIHDHGDPGNETVGVIGNGLVTEDGDPVSTQNYTVGPNGRITANGGDKDDSLALAPDVTSAANLHGGAGNDRLFGGAGNDSLFGDAGLDLLVGGAGNDLLDGGADQDYLDGQDGNDTLLGGSEADNLVGGAGADVLNGGPGFDTASYVTSPVGIYLDLENTGASSGDAQGDTYISIERFVGSNFADTMLGTAGSDNMGGGDGNDSLDGREGDDLLVGDAGADTLNGGAGNDFAAYTLSQAAVNVSLLTGLGHGGDAEGDVLISIENLQGSSAYGDTLEGDDGSNWLRGLDGNNILRGLGGDDLLEGGKDNDSLEGGVGNDTLRASTDVNSHDPLVSGGHDTLLGGDGNDFLYGDDGGDLLDGGNDDDQIFGGRDNDTIFGGAGQDLIHGGAGNDLIDGGEGHNLIYGEDGNDVITAGAGNDTIDGGTGNDTISSSAGDDMIFGSDGDDVLDAGFGSDRVDGGNGNDLLSVGNLRGMVQDSNRLDHLFGGAGIDTISADFSNQTVPITIVAGPTQSLIFADGTEARDFENVHDLFTGSGNDSLRLEGAADDSFGNYLRTGAGNDTIYSGAGNDNVDAGDGDDLVNGGFNDAVLTYNAGLGNVTGFSVPGDTLAGGAGNDTLSFEGFYKQAPDNIAQGVRLGVVINLGTGQTGGAASGITIGGFENIIGTNYGDDLTGDDGPNFFDPLRGGGSLDGTNHSFSAGASGPDRIDGGAGDDTLRIDFSVADPANSLGIVTAGAGFFRNTIGNTDVIDSYSYFNIENLQITGASKDDLIYASFLNGNDTLIGLAGNDTLGGNGGSDVLLGGDGNDVLAGQAGSGTGAPGYTGIAGGHDIFDGGPGDDLVEDVAFNINSFSGFFLSADALFQLDGGTGFDTLSADFSNESQAIVWSSLAPTNVDFADGAYFHNFEQLRNFSSGSGNDSITQLGRFDNRFSLGAGNDTLNPGIGFDTVYGGAGDDLLILDYSAGDSATALGIDSSFNLNDGGLYTRRDSVTGNYIDFITFREIERLQVTGSSHDDTLTGTSVGDDTLDGADGNDLIHGNDGNDHLFGGNGNDHLFGDNGDDFLAGGAGNDTLEGGVGSDSLDGGNGADYLLGGAGVDTLVGGNGNDTLDGGTFADLMKGGAGNDTYYVDNPGDTVLELIAEGVDTVITTVDYTLGPNLENLTIADFSAANGTGNNSDNVLIGSQQNNLLSGLRGNDTLVGDGTANRGSSQRDTLTGGAGGDLFVLGTSSGRFYDDGNPNTDGQSDYALITDFTSSAGDLLQLFGSASQYLLSPSPVSGVPGTGLYFDQNSNGVLDSTDELMAILQSPTTLTRANVIDSAIFVNGNRPNRKAFLDSQDRISLGGSQLGESLASSLDRSRSGLSDPLNQQPAALNSAEHFLPNHMGNSFLFAPV